MRYLTDLNINKTKEFFLQLSYECLMYSEKAINGYFEFNKPLITIQYLNEAFHCIKLAQSFYLQNCEHGEIEPFESFFHQFMLLNDEFLSALESDHGLQWSLNELETLKTKFDELKSYLN